MHRIASNLKGLVVICALFASVQAAAEEVDHAREYARCMEIAPSDPNEAFDIAIAWKDLGGGDAAEHCASVALLYAGQIEYAARRLEVLAETIVAEPEFKGQILAQAGQAWLLQGDAQRADAALTAAVEFLQGRPEVLIDRSQARFAMTDYQGAVEDLDAAIAANPSISEAYTFRATAHRFLDALDKARGDIATALALSPDDPAALLERGILHRLNGNDGAARVDWLRVLEIDEDGEIARLARTNIEKMDVKVE